MSIREKHLSGSMMRLVFTNAYEIFAGIAGLTSGWLLFFFVFAWVYAGPSDTSILRWLVLILGGFCVYIGGMITFGMFILARWWQLLAYASLFLSLLAAIILSNLIVPHVVPPVKMGTDPDPVSIFMDAVSVCEAAPRFLVAELVLTVLASPPFLIRRLNFHV